MGFGDVLAAFGVASRGVHGSLSDVKMWQNRRRRDGAAAPTRDPGPSLRTATMKA